MKRIRQFSKSHRGDAPACFPRCLIFILLLNSNIHLNAAGTYFTFTLNEPCVTSAGVYQTNGALLATLWSNSRFFAAGTYTSNWNGLDYNGNAAAPGSYQIRVLTHNTKYVWDGAIGNTSAEMSGPTVHRGFFAIQDMAVLSTNGFYCSGYNEAQYAFRTFLTADPQHVKFAWWWAYDQFGNLVNNNGNIHDRNWIFASADSNWVYFGCPATVNPATLADNAYPGCIVASKVVDESPASFANGVGITNGPGFNACPMPNGIYAGTQPGLSGISVEAAGNLLAASVAPDNQVYLFNKLSGSLISSFSVNDPGRLAFSPDGSLWVTTSNLVVHYTNLNGMPSLANEISGLSRPLAVAVDPTNANLILVADGGGSQQLKAFDASGNPLWTYGQQGGYPSSGPEVMTNKFWFSYEGVPQTFVSFAPDGSFWVGDEENHRALHFSSSLSCLEQIMYQPHSYRSCVDQNNFSRVFNQFLEFRVGYTNSLSQSWTLANNWKAGVDANHIDWEEGLYEITTFTNGRTYGLAYNNTAAESELVELTTNGVRFTNIFPLSPSTYSWVSLGADGSVRSTVMNTSLWYEATLAGFDTNNNPLWNPKTLLATAPNGGGNPVPRCGSFGNVRTTISTNGILIAFDQSLNNGFHLGGIQVGGSNWLWQASPAVASMDGTGNYEISNGVTYAGDTLQALDRNIIYGYHGEFFRSEGEAGQHMHFYDDGLFVGQFGEASPGHSAYEGALPGFAGNGHSPDLVKTSTGDYYLWDNDESGHGPQRWHLVNARNIQELTGSGLLGGTISLTNETSGFPADVLGQGGNNSATLTWLPVTNATAYKVYYSLVNGGPFQTFATGTPATNCFIANLTNGIVYYFAVTATCNGVEGPPSAQARVVPFDSSQYVLPAGSLTEGGEYTPVIDVSSGALANGGGSYVGNEHLTGLLTLEALSNYGYGSLWTENVGSGGFALFDGAGVGINHLEVLSSLGVTVGSGWQNISSLQRQFRLDGVLGLGEGISTAAGGAIIVSVNDTNFHSITVVSPAEFNYARAFTISLTSTNQSTAAYTVNENPGRSHTFQFWFRGNVSLSATTATGAGAIIQGLFFDLVAAQGAPPPSPPRNFRSLGH